MRSSLMSSANDVKEAVNLETRWPMSEIGSWTHATIITDMDWERVLRFFMGYGTLPVDTNQVTVFPTHQEFQNRWGFDRETDIKPAHKHVIGEHLSCLLTSSHPKFGHDIS